MAYIKNYCTKLVFFLFCLSQIQGYIISKESDDPYTELFSTIQKSASRISGTVQHGLKEAGVPVDKLENIYQEYKNELDVLDMIRAVIMELIMYHYGFPKYYLNVVDSLKFKNPKIEKMVKNVIVINELANVISYELNVNFNEVNKEVVNKTKPIAKRLIPIVTDIEDIIFAIFPENNKEIKKN